MGKEKRMPCPECGAEMNRHATKVDYSSDDQSAIDPAFGGMLKDAYTCPQCGRIELRPASAE